MAGWWKKIRRVTSVEDEFDVRNRSFGRMLPHEAAQRALEEVRDGKYLCDHDHPRAKGEGLR